VKNSSSWQLADRQKQKKKQTGPKTELLTSTVSVKMNRKLHTVEKGVVLAKGGTKIIL
jgi:hypothetical protein